TRKGALAAVHPADLGAHVLKELVARTGIDPAAVEDVIMGCVTQVGPQALDLARTAWLSAGLPESTPGVTIDRQCGSSQQAVHFAAQGVMSGTQDLVVAAGVENMGMVPMGANAQFAVDNGLPIYGQGWTERYGTQEISQFRGAQLMCEKWGYTREQLERFALEGHRGAAARPMRPAPSSPRRYGGVQNARMSASPPSPRASIVSVPSGSGTAFSSTYLWPACSWPAGQSSTTPPGVPCLGREASRCCGS